jgi:hypothetical protein
VDVSQRNCIVGGVYHLYVALYGFFGRGYILAVAGFLRCYPCVVSDRHVLHVAGILWRFDTILTYCIICIALLCCVHNACNVLYTMLVYRYGDTVPYKIICI